MKRKIRVPGEETELICEECEAVRTATWDYDDYRLDDGTVVKGVMIAHCNECGAQAGLASQSSYLIREAREKKKRRLRTTVTLSRALRDLAESRLLDVGTSSMNAVEVVVLSLVAAFRNSNEPERYLKKLRELKSEPLLSKSKLDDTVTIRLSQTADEAIQFIAKQENLNRSEFVRLAILFEDSQVQKNLESFALV